MRAVVRAIPGPAKRLSTYLGWLLCLLAGSVGAAAQSGPNPAEDAGPPPPMTRDALFKLPDSTTQLETPRQGGATQKEWEVRFAKVDQDLWIRVNAEAEQVRIQ